MKIKATKEINKLFKKIRDYEMFAKSVANHISKSKMRKLGSVITKAKSKAWEKVWEEYPKLKKESKMGLEHSYCHIEKKITTKK